MHRWVDALAQLSKQPGFNAQSFIQRCCAELGGMRSRRATQRQAQAHPHPLAMEESDEDCEIQGTSLTDQLQGGSLATLKYILTREHRKRSATRGTLQHELTQLLLPPTPEFVHKSALCQTCRFARGAGDAVEQCRFCNVTERFMAYEPCIFRGQTVTLGRVTKASVLLGDTVENDEFAYLATNTGQLPTQVRKQYLCLFCLNFVRTGPFGD